jgi:uncharacterized protein (TIGR02679 family)
VTSALPDRLSGDGVEDLWRRCWRAMARGGPDGWEEVTVRVPVEDDTVRRAVAGLLGRPLRPGVAATAVRLRDLDEVLRRAGDGWDLVRTVEAVHGPLPDRVAAVRALVSAVADARDAALAVAPNEPWVTTWLEELGDGPFARLHGRGELELVTTAARVLAELPAEDLPLPVLSARVTGDTKALSGTTLTTLVLRALACRAGEPAVPRSAAGRRELWEAVGVVPDDLASQVLVLGLDVADGRLGRWLTEAAEAGLPFRVTLHQLTRHPLQVEHPGTIQVCENPAVLRAAADRLGPASSPLVCTEGRPSVACTRLLTSLATAGCEVRYHGDFDWPGLRIAADVLHATGGSAWRFGASDYLTAIERGGPGRRPLHGTPATSPWDPDLAEAMQEKGEVVHEEDVLDDLLADLA